MWRKRVWQLSREQDQSKEATGESPEDRPSAAEVFFGPDVSGDSFDDLLWNGQTGEYDLGELPSLIERAREARLPTERLPESIRRLARPAVAVIFTALAAGVIGGAGDRAKVSVLSTDYMASPALATTSSDGVALGDLASVNDPIDGQSRVETPTPAPTNQVTPLVVDSTSSTMATSAPSTTADPTTTTSRATTTIRPTTTTAAPTTTTSPSTTSAPSSSTTTGSPSTLPPSTTASPTTDRPTLAACRPWTLAIDEHFDGGALELTRWEPLIADGEDGVGLRRPSTLVVGEGVLSIRASMVGGQPWGGALNLHNDEPYGRYEVRVRTVASPLAEVIASIGIWPTAGGEDAIGGYEIYRSTGTSTDEGAEDSRHFNTIFHPTLSEGATTVIEHAGDASQWETLVLEWTPEGSTLLRNDVVVHSLDLDEHPILEAPSALGIRFDTTASTLSESAVLEVDFVRVHRWQGCN